MKRRSQFGIDLVLKQHGLFWNRTIDYIEEDGILDKDFAPTSLVVSLQSQWFHVTDARSKVYPHVPGVVERGLGVLN